MDWLRKALGLSQTPTRTQETVNAVQFDLNDPLAAEHTAIRNLLAEYVTNLTSNWYSPEVASYENGRALLSKDRDEQARVVSALTRWMAALDERVERFRADANHKVNLHLVKGWDEVWGPRRLVSILLIALMRRRLPLPEETVRTLANWCADSDGLTSTHYPVGAVIQAVEAAVRPPADADWSTTLSRLLTRLREDSWRDKAHRKYAERLEALLGKVPEIPIDAGEAWSDAALADLQMLPRTTLAKWMELLAHARAATGSTPSAKWMKTAAQSCEAIGLEAFRTGVARWFSLTQARRIARALDNREWRGRCAIAAYSRAINRLQTAFATTHGAGNQFWPVYYEIQTELQKSEDPWHYLRTFPSQDAVRKHFDADAPTFDLPEQPPAYDAPEDHLLSETNMDILRGLAWMCGLQEDRELARALVTLALSAYRKVPGKGPRAVRVGNACITALGMMPGLDAVGQLALLKVKVKFGTAQIAIEKALTAAAEREGLPREELEEMSVPAYGLTEVGRLVETLGEFTAELTVAGTKSVEIVWRRADGKVQKSLPAAVKKEFAEELKELNAAKKDIEKMLPAQAERIDALFLQQKTWPLETWLERYLEHPLVGTLARRLIWNFTTDGTTTPGLWLDGKLVDRLGHAVPLDAGRTTVALWHPLDQAPDVVLGWRAFLEEWQIVQPFKQAHREVYVLTPAEERTGTYSNRFAAHILKQHQFHALCAARGWKNKLRLMVDDEYPPATRLLPLWGLRAEFWIEGAGSEYGADTNEAGTYLYLSTDQVRFYRIDTAQLIAHAGGGGYGAGWHQPIRAEPLALADIPPLVFSEIMRDVDLFVGVASVGNDPAWADGGRRETERNAWAHFSFGDLSATAQTRRDLLQRLVPKLKIASRCSFEEKFLVVRGELRTYKIHLGSGNILMAPNDQYLCIVPGSSGKAEDGKVFLPFEGDRTLSVILSKAFLLAADAKITDPSITRQIGIASR